MTSPARKPAPDPRSTAMPTGTYSARATTLIGQAIAMLQQEGATAEQATYLALRSAATARSDAVGMPGAAETLTGLAVEFAEGVRP